MVCINEIYKQGYLDGIDIVAAVILTALSWVAFCWLTYVLVDFDFSIDLDRVLLRWDDDKD